MRLLLSVVLVLMATQAPAALRVEPPFWWADMKHTRLQIVVEAPNVADAEVSLREGDAKLLGVQRGDSHNYQFLDLDLASATPGSLHFDLAFPDGTSQTFKYELRQRAPGSAQRQGFGPRDLIYLIVPDRFANGDTRNDVIAGLAESKVDRNDPNARHGGDIAGIVAHLEYLQGLGVTQLWPTPLVENDAPQFSYHGYGATDFYAVDPRFGSNADVVDLSRQARERGMGLIQDIVLNHIGSGHRWVSDPPTHDWLGFDGTFTPTNHARTTLQDPYAADIDRKKFNAGWFTETLPDLNQQQPLLATYLIQMSLWWIEFAGLSGIRQDTYPYADHAFLNEWGRRIALEYPNFNIVGEEWSDNPVVVSYWQKGNARGNPSSTPSMMDFPLYYQMLSALTGEERWDAGLIRLYQAPVNDVLYGDPNNLVLFDGNHDTARLYSLLDEDFDAWKMAIAFLFTAKRIPQLFYGTELLMTSPKERNDGLVRADFPGGWTEDKSSAISTRGLSRRAIEAQNFIRTLANFRRNTPALHRGDFKHYFPENGVYVYFRYDTKDVVMVAINKSTAPHSLALDRFSEVLESQAVAKNVVTGTTEKIGSSLALAARSTTVLVFKAEGNRWKGSQALNRPRACAFEHWCRRWDSNPHAFKGGGF